MSNQQSFALFILLGVLCSSGCQNTVTVRVERVMGISTVRPLEQTEQGQRLASSIQNLGDLADNVQKMQEAIELFAAGSEKKVGNVPPGMTPAPSNTTSSPSSDEEKGFQAFAQVFEPASPKEVAIQLTQTWVNACVQIQKEARDRIQEGNKYWAGNDRQGLNVFLMKVTGFAVGIPARLDAVEKLTRETSPDKFKELSGLQKHALRDAKSAALQVLLSTRSLRQNTEPGFGGFVATDVFTINPSDAEYEQVFGGYCDPCGKRHRPKLSFEPITKANIGASGDSSLMIVFENPGQVRVYQISNDPTMLARNISLLITKATAAAAKFMSAGVFPF